MALVAKRRVVVNAGRRRNRPRRLTPKQIKFFGTPAQKAALKRKRQNARASATKVKRVRATNPHRRRHRSRRRAARNPGEILSLVLNPGRSESKKGSKKMAATKRRRRSRAHTARRRRRSNPHHVVHHRRRRRSMSNPRRYHRRRMNRRRNPGGAMSGGVKQNMTFLLAGAAGFFGSKVLTQAVMGANNTGIVGYFGNAVATGALALTAYAFKFRRAAGAIVAGGVLQIAARAVTDYTPFGQYASSLGLGDYQAQNFVTPQRLIAPLESAAIEIPAGWGAPAVAVQTAGVPASHSAAGMHGYNTGGMARSMYSGRGLYS